MTRDTKREALRQRIEAAQERLAGRSPQEIASDAAESAVSFAKENPWVVVGGVVAAGLIIASFTRSGKKAAKSTSLFTRIATDAAIGFALAMYEKANEKVEVGIAKGQDLIEQATATK